MGVPSPFVYWAQTESGVSLKIDLKNVATPEVNVLESSVNFASKGVGAHGESLYQFNLDLYSPVKTDGATTVRVFENRVEVILLKQSPNWWPRLTAQPQKPAWLKEGKRADGSPDVKRSPPPMNTGNIRGITDVLPAFKINFDLWKSEGGDSDEEDRRDVMRDYPGMFDRLQKEEIGYRKEDLKKVYLVIYNLLQWVGFVYVLAVMGVRYARLDYRSVPGTYENVGGAMKFLQLMMYLEALHPLFGYTKGGALIPFVQISGRSFILFAMIDSEPRMQTKPVVFYLFLCWCAIEVVRYPYYITQLYKKEVYILTWLRYTMWVPLYPMGVLCEAIIILRNIPYFEETQRFTVSLPNEWNFAFHLPSILRVYLLFLTLPGLYVVMSHMRKLRAVKLRTKVVIKKSK